MTSGPVPSSDVPVTDTETGPEWTVNAAAERQRITDMSHRAVSRYQIPRQVRRGRV